MKRIVVRVFSLALFLLIPRMIFAYSHADTLRGSDGPGRSWWDVRQYQLSVKFDTLEKSINGSNQVIFQVTGTPHDSMQIDLQVPMILDSAVIVRFIDTSLRVRASVVQDGNVWWLKYPFSALARDSAYSVILYYHGSPRKAINPPWDGGFSWKRDSMGKQWIAVSCQGLGASVWWPCKDAQWDEPDNGMRISLQVPGNMEAISNGRMTSMSLGGGYTTTTWEVTSPINNYDVTFYVGDYVHWTDTVMGEKGKLDLDFYVLKYNEARARKQFEVVKRMIHCFEYWMGPYPFYEDGYKLVESPYLGMEHQSAVAYGNGYRMGYKGRDRSGTGYGLGWDYIIIHESGHEWFGNNITARDMADNWIHEGITSFSESLFTECELGKEKGLEYSRGLWSLIRNDKPLVAPYGVNDEGTGDIYEKGEAIMHMVRAMIDNDERFRNMLRGMGQEYYHKTVTTQQIETYIASKAGLPLNAFFDQYLRTTDIPLLVYSIKKKELSFKFENVVPGFYLPLTVTGGGKSAKIVPTGDWQQIKWEGGYNIEFSKDFLIKVKK
jgi:aminopeptidase N